MLADYSVHAALWCQRQNQRAFLILHIDVETAKARQEHHLSDSILQICGEIDRRSLWHMLVSTLNKL